MKLNRQNAAHARRQLDEKLSLWRGLPPRPKHGWLKAIRESLGMTAGQLGQRLGTSGSSVLLLEKREQTASATLSSLEKAAQAMGCRVHYAIVPHDTLEEFLEVRCEKIARKILNETAHTMSLEAQSVRQDETERQIRELVSDLKRSLQTGLWEEEQ